MKEYKKLLLTAEDLKRITTKIVKVKTSKGIGEVQAYSVDGQRIDGGIKQAEDTLKQKIWDANQKRVFKKQKPRGFWG